MAYNVQPWLGLASQLVIHVQLALKASNGCGWPHQLVAIPWTCAMISILVLQSHWEPRVVSLINLCAMATALSSMAVLVFAGDPCMTSLHSQSGPLLESVVGTVCFIMVGFLLFPVVMEHHCLSAAVGGVATVLIKVQQLVSTHDSAALLSRDTQWAVLAICLTTVLTCQLSCVGRYRLTALNRQSFLSSLRLQET